MMSSGSIRHVKKTLGSVSKVTRAPKLALAHFDGLYGKFYGRGWPSMRLGLLSPKKYCAVMNTFLDDQTSKGQVEELGAINLRRYYMKHLQQYTRLQLREKLIENKKIRKRELLAKATDVDIQSIDIDSVEVSDVSDSELRGAQTTDASDAGFSTAEDLLEMFSDRRMDEDEKYFINKASTRLSLEDFVPSSEMIREEETTHELDYYEGYDNDVELEIAHQDEPALDIVEQLGIYTFPRLNWTRFDEPTMVPKANLLSYYLIDGASILPVLALDLRMGDVCADYCAAPGGKSLAMLMTLRPSYLLCNDSSASRLGRLMGIFKQYAPNISYCRSTLKTSNNDAKYLVNPDGFDKILVDVPCSNDRNSVESIENNLFKPRRVQERLQLPRTQVDILKSALRSLRSKGAVVYSTCTLSPVENDGVVQRAIFELQEERNSAKFAIVNLKEAFRPLRGLFKFKTNFKYGQQVLPFVCSNFGPMYISKIRRLD